MPQPRRAARGASPRRPAFTLTELLVVIAIIAMLVALVSVGVMRAMGTARQTRVKVELDQLDLALKEYKNKYGAYPPCDLRYKDPNVLRAIAQHVVRAFPRYNLGPNNSYLADDLAGAGLDGDYYRPDQAIVFWLRGFSPDPAHPFVTTLDYQLVDGMVPNINNIVKRTPLYDFDASRLATKDTRLNPLTGVGPMASYFPLGSRVTLTPSSNPFSTFPTWEAGAAPYVYFDANNYGVIPMNSTQKVEPKPFNMNAPMFGHVVAFDGAGTGVPYWHDLDNDSLSTHATMRRETWANPEGFQLLAPGGDGKYGFPELALPVDPPRLYPTGAGYDSSTALADDDNVTNFCDSARLGDKKP